MRRISSQAGFTLIELLITVLIIGLLAAVSLGAYNGQRENARSAEPITVLRTAMTAVEAYYAEHGTYRGLRCHEPGDTHCGALNSMESTISALPPTPEGTDANGDSYTATPGPHADPHKLLVNVDDATDAYPYDGQYIEVCAAGKGNTSFCFSKWKDANPAWSYTIYGRAANPGENNLGWASWLMYDQPRTKF